MIEETKEIGILIDLDSLLDTRLGTIKIEYPDIYPLIEKNPRYYLRQDDFWNNVHNSLDRAKLDLAYQRRNLETIKNSTLTMIIRSILNIVKDINVKILEGHPEYIGYFFAINIYPYKLDLDAVKIIASAFLIQIGLPGAKIGFVDQSPDKVTLAYLQEQNIKHWYCYHFQQWGWLQFERLNEDQLKALQGYPELKVYTPMLSNNQDEIEKLKSELIEQIDVDQFNWTKIAYSSILTLEYLPTSIFCKLDVDKLAKLDSGETMERKDLLNVPFQAIKDVHEQISGPTIVDHEIVNSKLDKLEKMVYLLKPLNRLETSQRFREHLAKIMVEIIVVYNSTPFNAGSDLENCINWLSLQIDPTEEDYLETEKYWNNQGIKTIKREVKLSDGKTLYHCINYDTDEILSPKKKAELSLETVDDLILMNYFRFLNQPEE